MGGGLRPALPGQGEAPDQAGEHRQPEARPRVPGRGQHRGDGRADDEDRLVDHRLQRIGGLHLGRVAGQHVGPAGAHARPDRRVRRSGDRSRRERDGVGPPRLQARDEDDDRGGEDRGGDREHPRLAEPVEQPPLHDGQQPIGHGVRRGQRAGEPVGPGEAGGEQHDAEGVDGDGQPGDHRAGTEPEGAGTAEHDAVAGEHRPVSVGHDWRMTSPEVTPYDALLLVSFGGPEQPADVAPFLENVTRGRGIPPERLEEVGEHYFLFGGRSPINDLNRDLLTAIRKDLADHGIDLPVYWGNRNWDPYLTDAVAEMTADGVTRAACFVTSAYSSYSSCRQYREDLAAAVQTAARIEGPHADGVPRLDKLRHYFNHPGFVDPVVDATAAAVAELPGEPRLVFVTHSIPTSMNDASGPDGGGYLTQHRDVAAEVTARVRRATGRDLGHDLVFCSRSGPPQVPWLEPDVNDHLADLAADGVESVAIIPVGFVSDHMEVAYDLDTEALATAERLGLAAARVPTSGTDPRFVAMVRELLVERAAVERGEHVDRPAVGSLPPCWDVCFAGCCPNPRGPRPALAGRD
jgi:ferrochelatase